MTNDVPKECKQIKQFMKQLYLFSMNINLCNSHLPTTVIATVCKLPRGICFNSVQWTILFSIASLLTGTLLCGLLAFIASLYRSTSSLTLSSGITLVALFRQNRFLEEYLFVYYLLLKLTLDAIFSVAHCAVTNFNQYQDLFP